MYERNKLKKKHHQLVQKGHILDNQNHFLRKNQMITEPKINLKVIMYARTQQNVKSKTEKIESFLKADLSVGGQQFDNEYQIAPY